MPWFSHDTLPVHCVPRIKTRILVGEANAAQQTAVWEQWIEEGGHIPLHYHDVEEVLVLLTGTVALTLDSAQQMVAAPATIVVPAGQHHALHPVTAETTHLLAFFPVKDPEIFDVDGNLRPLPWQDR